MDRATVRIFALVPGAAPPRTEAEWKARAAATVVENRALEARARDRESEPRELVSADTGEDGRFEVRLDRGRLPPAGSELRLLASATISGDRFMLREDFVYEVPEELVALSNDDWDLGTVGLEPVRAVTLTVSVVAGGRPLAGARVEVEGVSTRTGATGRVTVEVESEGSISYQVFADGHAPFEGTTEDARAGPVTVELEPAVSVAVEVVDESGAPRGDLVVTAYGESAPPVGTRVDAQGRGSIAHLVRGRTYRFSVAPRSGSPFLPATPSAPAGTTPEPVRIVLARACSAAVSLRFEEDVPAPVRAAGVALQLERQGDRGWESHSSLDRRDVGQAIERGEPARFGPLAAGTYRVTALADPGGSLAFAFSAPFQVTSSGTAEATLELGTGVVVGGWLKAAEGASVDSWTVRFAECAHSVGGTGEYVAMRIPRNASLTATLEASNHAPAEMHIGAGETKLRVGQLVAKKE